MGGNSATWGPGLAQLDSQGWVDTAEGYAKSGYNAAKDYAKEAWNYLPQAEAEAEDVDAIIDQVGKLSLDDVYGAGVSAWNDLAQTEAGTEQWDMLEDVGSAVFDLFAQTEAGTEQWDMLEDVGGAIYDLFAQMEQKAPHE